MSSENLSSEKVLKSKGTKDEWPDDCHNFMTICDHKWVEADHDGFSILDWLNRADPVKAKAGKCISSTQLAKDDPKGLHAKAAGKLAYATLNRMFLEGSPAKTVIRSMDVSGDVVIGQGLELLQALHEEFARTKTTVFDVSKRVFDLQSIRMATGEGAGQYVRRFDQLVGELKRKDPPQEFPTAILMQWLSAGLSSAYDEVKKLQKRGEYELDMKLLVAAVHQEESIFEQDPVHGAVANIAGAEQKKIRRKANKKARKAKIAEEDSAAAAAAHSSHNGNPNGTAKGGAKGKGKPGARNLNKQCYSCWAWGHVSSECPGAANAVPAQSYEGVDPGYGARFTFQWGFTPPKTAIATQTRPQS